jgi:large subunit ribosomal protein L7/L12
LNKEVKKIKKKAKKKKIMNEKIKGILEELKSLTLVEAAELVSEMEKVFGIDTSVSISASVGSTPMVTTTPSVEIVEEKTQFDVFLQTVPADKKIAILKIVRNVTGFGLKESKDIVDNVPKVLKEGLSKEEAETIKKDVEAAGGTVTLK